MFLFSGIDTSLKNSLNSVDSLIWFYLNWEFSHSFKNGSLESSSDFIQQFGFNLRSLDAQLFDSFFMKHYGFQEGQWMSLFPLFIQWPNDSFIQLFNWDFWLLWDVDENWVNHGRVCVLLLSDFLIFSIDWFFRQVNIPLLLINSQDSKDLPFADLHNSMNSFGHYLWILI